MSEDDPSAGECDERARQFAQVTGTDQACAHFFLQDCDWRLQIALNRFFESADADGGEKTDSPDRKRMKISVEEEGESEGGDAGKGEGGNMEKGEEGDMGKREGGDMGKREGGNVEKGEGGDMGKREECRQLKVLTWNIDGLDEANLPTRTKAVCAIITRCEADVVFLQEVVDRSWTVLQSELQTSYVLVSGRPPDLSVPYFTAILLRRHRVQFISQILLPFTSTAMGRALLQVQGSFGGRTVQLLCTHLESMRDHAKERKRQLRTCFDRFRSLVADGDTFVLFGGDLNARDNELSEVGVPSEAMDTWMACGSEKTKEYTWDMSKNDNKHFDGKWKPRARFDRLFFNRDGGWTATGFELVGQQTVRVALCYPSDHWGVLVTFQSSPTNLSKSLK